MAEERRALSEERLAASRAADEARVGQLRLAEAVRAYVQQGVPIPFVMDGALSSKATVCTAAADLRLSMTGYVTLNASHY